MPFTYLLTPLHVTFCFIPHFFPCIAHARAGPTNMNFWILDYQRPCPALSFSTRPAGRRSPLSPLAAQRNGEKRMCSPIYLLMLPVCEKLALLTGIHRAGPYSIASCGAVSCLINPRRACAARVTVLILSVSQCVYSRLFSHCRQRSGIRAIPTAPAQQAIEI